MQVPYSFAPAHLNKQRAGAVGALAEKYYREGKTVTAAEHQPEYLRGISGRAGACGKRSRKKNNENSGNAAGRSGTGDED